MTPEEFAPLRPTVPEDPGVYKYFNEAGEIIYIGKAKNLRKRVSSYFVKSDHSYRIQRMIHLIRNMEFTIVDTEQDAFLLENALIKQHQPRYNIALKDDKTYPYIVIKKESFPRVFFTRKKIDDGSEYLGPYTSVFEARTILQLLVKIFPLRTCTLALTQRNILQHKFKVCLEYHLKNCLGPCEAHQSEEDYNEGIRQIRNILRSNFATATAYLRKQMNEYAAQLQFEKANEFKEKIEILSNFQGRSTIVNPRLSNIEVYGYAEIPEAAFINFLKVRNGTIVQTRSFRVKRVLDETREEILATAITDNSFSETNDAQELILPFELSLPFESMQRTFPQAGDKKKLLDLAVRNAIYIKEEFLKAQMTPEEKKPSFRIMKTLKEDLRMNELPRHIECFDNSNLQGGDAVSACVVFREAMPSKKDYRIFNVKTVEGPDDFATMEEVILRRYKRMLDEAQPLPQLIVIDGGKGQLSYAAESLKKLELYGKITLVGIAKKLEEIYFPEDSVPLHINKKSESLKLIQRMRDEAHRFGITHHRKKRQKKSIRTELDDVAGIGPRTREQLLRKFGSVKHLRELTVEELGEVVGPAKAKLLRDYFDSHEAAATAAP